MDIDVTVDVDAEEVLEEMEVKDVIKYLINQKDDEFTDEDVRNFMAYLENSTNVDFGKVILERLDPWEILTTVAAPYIPRNCTDKQSILDGIQEYLSRVVI